MILKSKRFILRPFKKSDATAIAKHINNKNVERYLAALPYPYTLQHARDFIKKNLPNYKAKIPSGLNLAIVINNEVCGGIGFHSIEYKHQAEMGYWLSQQYWGNGIMTKAVKLFTDFGFKKFKLVRIWAKVHTPNIGSKIVLERNGFKVEGILKKGIMKNNKYVDAYILAKVK
jgi:RimJ/RimL family protein N-acetyltransferase